jgi:hypothetical protein
MRPPPRRRARWLASPPRSQRQRDPSSSFQHPFYCLRGGSVRAFDNPMIFHIFHKWRAPEYYWSSQKPKERCVHPRFQLSNGRGRLTAQFHSAAYTAKLRIRVRAGDTYTIYTFAHGCPAYATANSSSRAMSSPRFEIFPTWGSAFRCDRFPEGDTETKPKSV